MLRTLWLCNGRSAEHRIGLPGRGRDKEMLASKESVKMPKWARTFLSASPTYIPLFEEIRDCYTYLRSTRALHERSRIQCLSVDTLKKLDFVFTPEGFASFLDVKILIHSLCDELVGPSDRDWETLYAGTFMQST